MALGGQLIAIAKPQCDLPEICYRFFQIRAPSGLQPNTLLP